LSRDQEEGKVIKNLGAQSMGIIDNQYRYSFPICPHAEPVCNRLKFERDLTAAIRKNQKVIK